ncbi:pimeloyl-ACP methyl ester carboxylesterase [Balneicella halophila]|uniref:Pimeloyl-ACP methyl ester carboxylesterase n=1 Tax=Balneicella halophila TaxID=1537566 RepID=A0A7L4URF7_BALHA|nr:alpha/beta fold hydrolase [Balneicella halophila]PVX52346.1 pimeloyl-ACP methyl ester carboxylesterase [Balneicella halophila]
MKLHSTISGEGAPLLILHGLYGCSDNWLTIAKELSEDFCIHRLDLRNHGRSPHSDEHNYTVMAEDIKEYMNDHELKKAIILGHSMGGKVAMLFTLTYPDRVDKLIVADIAPKNYTINYDGHIKILDVMRSLDLDEVDRRKEIEEQLTSLLKSEKVVKLVMKNLHRKKDKTFEWRINLPVLYDKLENITGGTEGWDKLQTKVPALFIKGENSHYLTLEDDFIIRKSFSNSELTVIPNAGHWLHAEQPELVIKTILYFIK